MDNTNIDAVDTAGAAVPDQATVPPGRKPVDKPVELRGPKGLEPTRYGDWERQGRCIDF